MVHDEESPLAGTTVKLVHRDGENLDELVSAVVDDWWDRVQNTSWRNSNHKLATNYKWRRQVLGLPDDDNVLYVRLNDTTNSEQLVHVSEIIDFA